MKKIPVGILAVLGAMFVSSPSVAHHSFAMFDNSQYKLVEGTVVSWAFNNPHSWLIIEAPDAEGEMVQWAFEGAAPPSLVPRGVTGSTYEPGDFVRVVMQPLRDGRNAGALCFVEIADGTFTEPNDAVCRPADVISAWQENGWLAEGKHLDTHPAPEAQ